MSGNTTPHNLPDMMQSGTDIVDVDWMVDIAGYAAQVGGGWPGYLWQLRPGGGHAARHAV